MSIGESNRNRTKTQSVSFDNVVHRVQWDICRLQGKDASQISTHKLERTRTRLCTLRLVDKDYVHQRPLLPLSSMKSTEGGAFSSIGVDADSSSALAALPLQT